jgi:putative sterol carrier protein
MAMFFSPEWVSEVDDAVQASTSVGEAARGKRFVFQQVATGSPVGDVSYHLVVTDGAVRAVAGAAAEPTVTITGPWDVHVRINKGEISPPVALLSGKGRVSGDRMKLMTERNLLSAVHECTIAVPVAYEPTPAGPV